MSSCRYEWKVLDTQRVIPTGGLFRADWKCTAIEEQGGYSNPKIEIRYGTYTHKDSEGNETYPSPNDSRYDSSSPDYVADWIPFEDLTEEIVLTWIYNDCGKSEIETILYFKLQGIHAAVLDDNIPMAAGLPWEQPDAHD